MSAALVMLPRPSPRVRTTISCLKGLRDRRSRGQATHT
jgi:hypothetical protein